MATADLFQENSAQIFAPPRLDENLPQLALPERSIPGVYEEPTFTVNENPCTVFTAAGGGEGRTPYSYEYSVAFNSPKDMADFEKAPGARETVKTIQNTVTEAMNPILNEENLRDGYRAAEGFPYDDAAIKSIDPNTTVDIDLAMGDTTRLIQQQFPEAGIKEIRMEKVEGGLEYCRQPGPNEWYLPEQKGEMPPVDIQAPAQQQMAMSGGIRAGLGGPGF